jgi:hypothetical protein
VAEQCTWLFRILLDLSCESKSIKTIQSWAWQNPSDTGRISKLRFELTGLSLNMCTTYYFGISFEIKSFSNVYVFDPEVHAGSQNRFISDPIVTNCSCVLRNREKTCSFGGPTPRRRASLTAAVIMTTQYQTGSRLIKRERDAHTHHNSQRKPIRRSQKWQQLMRITQRQYTSRYE